MFNKYAIPVTLATEELCVFLNDGRSVDLHETNKVLLVEINGPREITTKLCFRDEVMDGPNPKDPDVTVIVGE